MIPLAAACVLFVGIHVFVSGTTLRDRIVGAIGEGPYRGVFSLASAGALLWIGLAYRTAEHVDLWSLGTGARHGAAVLMFVALLLVILGQTQGNPTSVGQKIDAAEPARGITRITRHPFLWGVAVWSVAHLLANGHLAALLLFGSLLVLALVGPFLIDGKLRRRAPADFGRLAAVTSWVPFAAILGGRNRLVLAEFRWWQVPLTVAVYVVILLWAHGWVFGLSPLG